ncbi:GSCOCG00011900001-RA-CDS [Cotesia congregata]|nr:GSCOCG00011900001-RA-CDS [Cotesia congregata]
MNTQTAVLRLCDDIRLTIDGHKSYLTNRSQAVKHGDCLSSWQCSRSGVLQGSVLEPLLFSLFVSTLGLQIESKHLFYADDLVVYVSCSISDLNDAVLQLNADVDLIVEWCTNNLLKLNAAKTKSIIFNSPWHVKDQACVSARKIVTGDVVTNYSVSVKYLGIILDHTLSWHDQVIAMCNRSMYCLARLKMNNDLFNLPMRKRLVSMLIFPIFDYCTLAYTDMSGTLQKKLQRKFNACIRFIFRLARYDHVTPSRRLLG